MSFLTTMTTEQLAQNGFDISPTNPDLAISRLYPHLSFRHRCQMCGNWSRVTNGKCSRCFVDKPPLSPTRQNYKLYLGCCDDDACPVQREARRFLAISGIEDRGHCFDGNGEYLPFDVIKSWPEEERTEFFEAINDFSVSKFGARLLCHPNSKQKSKLPKRPK